MITITIEEAKKILKDTVGIYLKKRNGAYILPQNKQRPVYLEGPAGIGKTEIVQQAAQEAGIGFVSYSMTHHNRQSAVGLPAIVDREGEEGSFYKATEYTMSEIVDSVWEARRNGYQEGILFADEVNCVSETLTAAMLQFLQNKTLGPHKIPEGWIIVAAGNPPEYNKSVKPFDTVTRDRLRYISIRPDVKSWLKYGLKKGFHPIVLQYVRDHEKAFYYFNREAGGQSIVTARGWEDLSNMLQMYEENDLEVTEDLVQEFLQEEKIAVSFMGYYRTVHSLMSLEEQQTILDGQASDQVKQKMQGYDFQKRYAVLLCLLNLLEQQSRSACSGIDELLKKREAAKEPGLTDAEKKDLTAQAKALDKELDHIRKRMNCLLEFADEADQNGRDCDLLINMLLENETFQKLSAFRRMDNLIALYKKRRDQKEAVIRQIDAWSENG